MSGFSRTVNFMRIVISITAVVLLAVTTSYAADTVVKDQRLVQAVKAGDTTTAIALIGKRADPNVAEPDGTTPLHWAVRNNDTALVERLIRAGADVKAAKTWWLPKPMSFGTGSAGFGISGRL